MTFRDKLYKLNACDESLEWVGNKTIEEAWKTCENSDWMIWVLTKTRFDLTDPICDMVERVLNLVPENIKITCNNAIRAARSHASKDELYAAAYSAYSNYSAVAYDVSRAAGYAARYAYYSYYSIDTANAAASAAADAAVDAAADAIVDAIAENGDYVAAIAENGNYVAACGISCTARINERKKQCSIIRKYFTIDQVREAFNKLVA